jgi:hypothetical protein
MSRDTKKHLALPTTRSNPPASPPTAAAAPAARTSNTAAANSAPRPLLTAQVGSPRPRPSSADIATPPDRHVATALACTHAGATYSASSTLRHRARAQAAPPAASHAAQQARECVGHRLCCDAPVRVARLVPSELPAAPHAMPEHMQQLWQQGRQRALTAGLRRAPRVT